MIEGDQRIKIMSGRVDRNREARERRQAARSNQPTGLAKVSGFSSRSTPSKPHVARMYDPVKTPDGYDSAVWHLTLLFMQRADEHGIELATPRPVIYSNLDRKIKASGIREASEKYLLKSDGSRGTWVEFMTAVVETYWRPSRDAKAVGLSNWNEYAADDFLGRETFERMMLIVHDRALVNRIEARRSKEVRDDGYVSRRKPPVNRESK